MLRNLLILLLIVASITGCGGKSKDELYAEGLKKVKEGNLNGAIVLFRSALEKDQNYLDARYQLGKAYLDAGKYDSAEKEFNKVLHANPSRKDITIDLAKVYNGTRKPDQAIRELQEYFKTNPETADSLETLAVAYALSNRMEEAEQILLKVLKLDPNRVTAKLELAGVYAGQKKIEQAKELLAGVIREKPGEARAYLMLAQIELSQGNKEKALKVYEELVKVDPKNPIPLYKIGLLLKEMGQTDKATAMADDLLKQFPKRGEGYRLKGLLYYQKGTYAEAITTLQKSIQLQPTVEGYYFLGMSMYMLKDYESAMSQFRVILDRSPDLVQVRLMVAMILLNQQRLDDSIAELQKIIKENDRIALAHNMLGNAFMAKGMFTEGMRELNRATELDPKLVDAYLKKGVYHLSMGNLRETESDLKTAVQVAPDVLNNRLILSAYYLRLKNFDKAVDVLKEGLTKTKADAALFNNIASVMFMQKKNAEGLGYLQKAKEADPAFLNSYFNTATYYAKTGDQEKALAEYRAVLQKDPLNLKALLILAGYYESKGNDGEALTYFGKAIETKEPSAYVALANFYMKKNQSEKALAMIEDAIKKAPKNPDLLELKGRTYQVEKKTKDAISAFDQVEAINPERGIRLKIQTYLAVKEYNRAGEEARRYIEITPKSARGYMILAEIYEAQGNSERAIEELKKAARVDITAGAPLIQLGYTHARKKEYAQALSAFDEATRKDPKSSAPALFGIGTIYEEQGKKQEAVKKYREALQRSPNYVPALNNLATLYAEGIGGKPAEALPLAESAVRSNPNNPNILDTYGYVLLRNGRIAEARKVLERVSSVVPNNPSVNYHLALVYRETGDRAQAISRANKALEAGRFPEEAQTKQLKAELTGVRKAR